ncbi:MAG TPA: hypothetical protein VGI64_08265 [Streptosporangiaceae bacterium]|jgi:hypothetical protein
MSSAQERSPSSYERGAETQSAGRHGRAAEAPDQPGYGETRYQGGATDYDDGKSMAAASFMVLAATLMILSGLWSIFVGLTAIIQRTFFVSVPNYTFQLSVHNWGWVHLAIGALVFAAGVCLLLGMTWARIVGVALAVISGIANFLYLPYYPLWSIIVIAIDVFIIWALMTSSARRYMA